MQMDDGNRKIQQFFLPVTKANVFDVYSVKLN